MKRIVGFLLIGALSVSVALAVSHKKIDKDHPPQVIKPTLSIDHITLMNGQERDGDELYITLSARSKNRPTKYVRIPEAPDHWLSALINQTKEVPLWSESLNDGESIILVLELNEQDSLVLNPDDLLGVMQVKLTNQEGALNIEWEMPNRVDHHVVVSGKQKSIHQFDLQKNDAHYDVYLSLKK